MTLLLDRPRPVSPDILDDATRREVLIGAGAALLLAACGAGDRNAAAPPSPVKDGAAFPVTIEHRYGSTELRSEPQRVVTVGLVDHDAVLALGTVPVGITAGEHFAGQRSGVWPWAHDRLGDATPEVLAPEEISFERIAALRPDLILAVYSGLTDQEYQTLSQIAPTVAQSAGHPDYQTPWDEMTRVIGRALGQTHRTEELIAGVTARFAQARQEHPEFEGKVAVYAGFLEPGKYYAETKGSSRVGVLTSLGFTIPDDIRADNFYAEISQEQLGLFDRDLLLWELADPAFQTEIESDPLYQQLDVARHGRDVFVVDPEVAAGLAFISVLSLPFVLDELVPLLEAALDGDPLTTIAAPGA